MSGNRKASAQEACHPLDCDIHYSRCTHDSGPTRRQPACASLASAARRGCTCVSPLLPCCSTHHSFMPCSAAGGVSRCGSFPVAPQAQRWLLSNCQAPPTHVKAAMSMPRLTCKTSSGWWMFSSGPSFTCSSDPSVDRAGDGLFCFGRARAERGWAPHGPCNPLGQY